MDSTSNCFLCTNYTNNSFPFSCGHNICSQCTSRTIFIDNLSDFQDKDIIQVRCKCTKSGTAELDLSQIMSLFKIHSMIEEKAKDKFTCTNHPDNAQEMYCKECQELICQFCCQEKSNEHFNHSYELLEEYADRLRSSVNDIPLTFRTFEDFATNFDQIGVKFKQQFEAGFNSTLSQIDDLIKTLGNLRVEYANTVKRRLERGVLVMKIVKMFFLTYYSDIKKGAILLDIKLLKYINEINYELLDMKFNYNNNIRDEIIKIKSQVEEMNKMVDKAVDIEYHFKKVSRDYQKVQTLTGHSSLVTALIQLKDGRIISGSGDHTIKIWKESQNAFTCKATIEEFTGYVIALLQIYDSRIASAARDNTIRIWSESENGFNCSQTLTEHNGWATSLIQLRDGRIASGSKDKTIRIWTESQNCFQAVHVLVDHIEGVYALIELNDGRLASGSDDSTIRIWEETEDSFKCTHTLTGHTKRVRSLLQMKDGRMVSGSDDAMIMIWKEIENLFICTTVVKGHSDGITSLIQLIDGRIGSASKDRSIRLWGTSESESESESNFICTENLSGHHNTIFTLIQLRDGRLVSGSSDKTLRVWKNRDTF